MMNATIEQLRNYTTNWIRVYDADSDDLLYEGFMVELPRSYDHFRIFGIWADCDDLCIDIIQVQKREKRGTQNGL